MKTHSSEFFKNNPLPEIDANIEDQRSNHESLKVVDEIVIETADKYTCEHCPEFFVKPTMFTKHLREKHDVKCDISFKCHICANTTNTSS